MAQPFIHLRARSAYSLLQSALHIDDLARLAVKHEMPALALTDANNLFGALEFSEYFAGKGVQPIVGLTLTVKGEDGLDGALALFAQNNDGYSNLMRLSTSAFLDVSSHDEPHVPLARVLQHAEGLIALTGGAAGPLTSMIENGHQDRATALLKTLGAAFANRLYVELHRHGEPGEAETEGALVELAYALGLPLVAANDIRFEARRRSPCARCARLHRGLFLSR